MSFHTGSHLSLCSGQKLKVNNGSTSARNASAERVSASRLSTGSVKLDSSQTILKSLRGSSWTSLRSRGPASPPTAAHSTWSRGHLLQSTPKFRCMIESSSTQLSAGGSASWKQIEFSEGFTIQEPGYSNETSPRLATKTLFPGLA